MKVRELLADESAWTKGQMARQENGMMAYPESRYACKWCLDGAIDRCYPAGGPAVRAKVLRELAPFLPDSSNEHARYPGSRGARCAITWWNDLPSTEFAHVRELVEKLDV